MTVADFSCSLALLGVRGRDSLDILGPLRARQERDAALGILGKVVCIHKPNQTRCQDHNPFAAFFTLAVLLTCLERSSLPVGT